MLLRNWKEWFPTKSEGNEVLYFLLALLQTLAHSLDSYHGLLSLAGEEEADVEERLQGHVRYSAALSDLCAREASIRREIAAERTLMLQLQNDVQALQVGRFRIIVWASE